MVLEIAKNFDVYFHAKKWTYSSPHSYDIAEILQAYYFGYFGHAWLWPSNRMASAGSKL